MPSRRCFVARSLRAAFTLVEMLIATALTLLIMAVAVNMIGLITNSIGDARGLMELSGRLRAAQHRLQLDLKYVTARMMPPLDPRHDLGYFEIIEGPGPYVPGIGSGAQPMRDDGTFDASVGDVDDIIMFTTRSHGEPFTGLWQGAPVQSQVAEVAWFMRGNKLYRRQLLVLPRVGSTTTIGGYYNTSDVSVRREGGQRDYRTAWADRTAQLTANTLGDLTKRENRFAHQPLQFPHDVRFWGQLGLPLIQETASSQYPLLSGGSSPDAFIPIPNWTSTSTGFPYYSQRDFWTNPMAPMDARVVQPGDAAGRLPDALASLYANARLTEDLILTNVIGFDVKVWDPDAPVFAMPLTNASGEVELDISGNLRQLDPVRPDDPAWKHCLAGSVPDAVKPYIAVTGTGAFVDLFYLRDITPADPSYAQGWFAGPGNSMSQLQAGGNMPAVYCTWSSHYENDGRDNDRDGAIDEGLDDPTNVETMPPYLVPLRAIQVKIRVFEPDSAQIREVTITQDFVR